MNPNGGDTGMADRGDDVRGSELADRVEEIADSLEHGYDNYAVSVLRKAARRLRGGGEGERERLDALERLAMRMEHYLVKEQAVGTTSGDHLNLLKRVRRFTRNRNAAPDTEEWELNPTCICGHSLAEHHWDEAGCEVCDCGEFEHYRVTPSTQEEPHWRAYDEMTDAERRRNRQELSQEGQGRDKWYKRYVTDPEFHAWVDRVVNRACELERDRLRGAPEGERLREALEVIASFDGDSMSDAGDAVDIARNALSPTDGEGDPLKSWRLHLTDDVARAVERVEAQSCEVTISISDEAEIVVRTPRQPETDEKKGLDPNDKVILSCRECARRAVLPTDEDGYPNLSLKVPGWNHHPPDEWTCPDHSADPATGRERDTA